MLIILAAFLIGALLGWRRATALGGNTKDKLQYAAVFGILFMLVGLIVTVVLARQAAA